MNCPRREDLSHLRSQQMPEFHVIRFNASHPAGWSGGARSRVVVTTDRSPDCRSLQMTPRRLRSDDRPGEACRSQAQHLERCRHSRSVPPARPGLPTHRRRKRSSGFSPGLATSLRRPARAARTPPGGVRQARPRSGRHRRGCPRRTPHAHRMDFQSCLRKRRFLARVIHRP